MGDDFDKLLDNGETNKNSFSSLDSVISVINDDGEEELVDLYQFYAEKSTRKKKTQDDETLKYLNKNHELFQKRKEVSPPPKPKQPAAATDIKESDNKNTNGEFTYLPYYRDHHMQTALEIQAKFRQG